MSRTLVVPCPVCGGSPSRHWARVQRWSIVRCTRCGLLITWPRPDPGTLERLYGDEIYYDDRAMGAPAKAAWLERAAGMLQELPLHPQTAVDLGAGAGHLVNAMNRLGIQAEGIEPSPAGRALAERLYGLRLQSAVSDGLVGRFDLATLIHSLEHVEDPVATLREAARLLAPEGRILIEVPHARTIEMLRPRRRREVLDLPAHLYHFVPETLARVAVRAGLRVMDVRLGNADALEWALALRERWRARSQAVPTESLAEAPLDGGGQPLAGAGACRSLWRSRILPWMRGRFPGWQFRMVLKSSS